MSTTAGSKLNVLRGRLAALRRARQSVRWGAAYSASATAVLWLLAGVWALDVAFSTSVAQRGVMLLIVVAGAVWSYSRWTLPLLGVSESEVDLALLVERQHRLDSDLVAALQFESPDASEWGSRQLEQAVIDRVSNLGQTLDVFTGFSREQLKRRGGTLGATVAGLALIAAIFPGHASTFLNRLLLGHKHYPTRTQIARVAINDQLVLDRRVDDTSPRRMAAPQGQLLKFYLRAEGRLPTNASARVQSLSGGVSRHVDLVPMTLDERRSRLQAALARTAQVAPSPTDAGKQPADNATSAGDAKPDDSAKPDGSVKPEGAAKPDGDAATSTDTPST
ncbi:MAG TPA: hypothetical protein PLV92_12435, partial [Pirellulaceae bacterium]|nr:hypothetical protein [Pirellulaceae bacterium]